LNWRIPARSGPQLVVSLATPENTMRRGSAPSQRPVQLAARDDVEAEALSAEAQDGQFPAFTA